MRRLLGVAAVNAGNAANYGARLGSVAQENPAGTALAAARRAIQAAPVGEYSLVVSGGGGLGSLVTVTVAYRVPNYFTALSAFFGVAVPGRLSGQAQAFFRQEGW